MTLLTRLDESHFTNWQHKDVHRSPVDESLVDETVALKESPTALTQADIDEAFAKGVAQGRAHALEKHRTDSLEREKSQHIQALEMIATSLTEQYTPLFDAIKSRQTAHVNAAIEALETVFADLLPVALSQKIRTLLLTAKESDGGSDKLCVHLHQTDLDTVQSDINDLVSQAPNSDIIFVSDESLPAGSCKVQWQGGQVSYDPYTPFHQLIAQLRDHYSLPQTLFSAQAKEETSND